MCVKRGEKLGKVQSSSSSSSSSSRRRRRGKCLTKVAILVLRELRVEGL